MFTKFYVVGLDTYTHLINLLIYYHYYLFTTYYLFTYLFVYLLIIFDLLYL